MPSLFISPCLHQVVAFCPDYPLPHFDFQPFTLLLYSFTLQFDGAAGERLCHACSIFASNQAKADKLCKEWKRKNDRFRAFLKVKIKSLASPPSSLCGLETSNIVIWSI